MSEIKIPRYEHLHWSGEEYPLEDGDFCKWEDVAPLLGKLFLLEDENSKLKDRIMELEDGELKSKKGEE